MVLWCLILPAHLKQWRQETKPQWPVEHDDGSLLLPPSPVHVPSTDPIPSAGSWSLRSSPSLRLRQEILVGLETKVYEEDSLRLIRPPVPVRTSQSQNWNKPSNLNWKPSCLPRCFFNILWIYLLVCVHWFLSFVSGASALILTKWMFLYSFTMSEEYMFASPVGTTVKRASL